MRRGRGRRGLEVLNRQREIADVNVEVTDEDAPQIKEVDAKLVALAQRFGCDVLTTDYNLNRVAQIQGVRVLNVNELSNAIRPVVIPGEEMVVKVVQPGKERNQGVGSLADGTMIVVENGDKLMDQEVSVEVTRVFQTVAGKMIFATPRQPIPTAPVPAPRLKSHAQTSAHAQPQPQNQTHFQPHGPVQHQAQSKSQPQSQAKPDQVSATMTGQTIKPSAQPAAQPVAQPAAHSAGRSVAQPVAQPAAQPSARSVDRPAPTAARAARPSGRLPQSAVEVKPAGPTKISPAAASPAAAAVTHRPSTRRATSAAALEERLIQATEQQSAENRL